MGAFFCLLTVSYVIFSTQFAYQQAGFTCVSDEDESFVLCDSVEGEFFRLLLLSFDAITQDFSGGIDCLCSDATCSIPGGNVCFGVTVTSGVPRQCFFVDIAIEDSHCYECSICSFATGVIEVEADACLPEPFGCIATAVVADFALDGNSGGGGGGNIPPPTSQSASTPAPIPSPAPNPTPFPVATPPSGGGTTGLQQFCSEYIGMFGQTMREIAFVPIINVTFLPVIDDQSHHHCYVRARSHLPSQWVCLYVFGRGRGCGLSQGCHGRLSLRRLVP
jgi:hypothetical protein